LLIKQEEFNFYFFNQVIHQEAQKKADTKLHLAHSTGKRVQATADKLMKTVRKRGKLPTKDNFK
jgi:uncharacterized protein (DUF2252 family)